MSLLKTIYAPLADAAFSISLKKLRKRYTEGINERMGIIESEKLSALSSRPLWIHAVSVGEVQAASALLSYMRAEGFCAPVVLSTTTETGKAMAMRLSEGLFDLHVYYPWDSRKYVKSALDAINPMAFILMETEIWPNMLWELEARNIPIFLCNGRISERTWKRTQNLVGKTLFRELFGNFAKLFLREQQDGLKMSGYGIDKDKIMVAGDLKIDALLDRIDSGIKAKWQKILHSDRGALFIAGSTHTGEDEIVVQTFSELKKQQPNARLILAPRHPERSDSLFEMLQSDFSVCKLSELTDDFEIVIIDKIGVLFEVYSVAEAAFVGGSFTDNGGQNILEPAAWGVPVQYGPHMEDFEEASKAFLELGISRQLKNAEDLASVWTEYTENKDKKGAVAEQCKKYFERTGGAARKSWKEIERIMTERGIFNCGMFR